MKKLRKTDLRFEKEVITALTVNELEHVKGGAEILTDAPGCVIQTTRISPCIVLTNVKTNCNTDSRINICITQTEVNSCRCVDM